MTHSMTQTSVEGTNPNNTHISIDGRYSFFFHSYSYSYSGDFYEALAIAIAIATLRESPLAVIFFHFFSYFFSFFSQFFFSFL